MDKLFNRLIALLWVLLFIVAVLGFAKVMLMNSVYAANAITEVQLSEDGGVYTVPIILNGQVTLDCMVDSGASESLVQAGAILKLKESGTIQASDILDSMAFTQASGDLFLIKRINIKLTQVGTQTAYNVPVGIGPSSISNRCLLGQSFLKRFVRWSIDNTRKVLILEGIPSNTPVS